MDTETSLELSHLLTLRAHASSLTLPLGPFEALPLPRDLVLFHHHIHHTSCPRLFVLSPVATSATPDTSPLTSWDLLPSSPHPCPRCLPPLPSSPLTSSLPTAAAVAHSLSLLATHEAHLSTLQGTTLDEAAEVQKTLSASRRITSSLTSLLDSPLPEEIATPARTLLHQHMDSLAEREDEHLSRWPLSTLLLATSLTTHLRATDPYALRFLPFQPPSSWPPLPTPLTSPISGPHVLLVIPQAAYTSLLGHFVARFELPVSLPLLSLLSLPGEALPALSSLLPSLPLRLLTPHALLPLDAPSPPAEDVLPLLPRLTEVYSTLLPSPDFLAEPLGPPSFEDCLRYLHMALLA